MVRYDLCDGSGRSLRYREESMSTEQMIHELKHWFEKTKRCRDDVHWRGEMGKGEGLGDPVGDEEIFCGLEREKIGKWDEV